MDSGVRTGSGSHVREFWDPETKKFVPAENTKEDSYKYKFEGRAIQDIRKTVDETKVTTKMTFAASGMSITLFTKEEVEEFALAASKAVSEYFALLADD